MLYVLLSIERFYDTVSVILARLMRVLIIFLIGLQMAASLTLGNAKALLSELKIRYMISN